MHARQTGEEVEGRDDEERGLLMPLHRTQQSQERGHEVAWQVANAGACAAGAFQELYCGVLHDTQEVGKHAAAADHVLLQLP